MIRDAAANPERRRNVRVAARGGRGLVLCETMRVVARLLTVAAAAGSAALALWACLPDLAPLPATSVPKTAYCGDGVVDWRKDGGIGEECDPGEGGSAGCSSVCTVDCPSGGVVDPASRHCYFLREPTSSLGDAVTTCRSAGAHVVTFASEDEYRFVHTWFLGVTRVADVLFWIGLEGNVTTAYAYLSNAPDEPGFGVPDASNCEGCFGKLPDASPYFGTLDGAAAPPRQLLCVVGTRGPALPWYQAPCTLPRGTLSTICEREPPGQRVQSCTDGRCIEIVRTQGAKKYLFASAGGSAEAAIRLCRTLASGSLVVLESPEEREQLGREIARLVPLDGTPLSSFWIGLASTGGPWQWDDGQAASARPSVWGDFEPRAISRAARAYVQLGPSNDYDTTLAHADPDPTTVRPFVCQYK